MSLRCAIYTRVSTEHGLEQEFNSLDNQREAAEAYVKSQAHEGWRLLRDRYDDGGFSGGSMERPALQRLLEQVKLRRVDVIVVYKVDRLTRSLADFAKLVELFDANGVSFVSVTQAFNTTTSMGRLTLNVLLSFAQFEREVTGERIRDKIAASRRRGLWTGGNVPLGYSVENRKLAIVEDEAEKVRLIFRRYLELGSIGKLLADLHERRVMTKGLERDGIVVRGAIPFTRGPLAYLLRNRIYVGETVFKGVAYPGEHPAILDPALFDAVQTRLDAQSNGSSSLRTASDALLAGKLFDDRGHRMMPSHATKNGVRYRYYVSRALLDGREADAGSVRRISAPAIEARILDVLQSELGLAANGPDPIAYIERIEVGQDRIRVAVRHAIRDGEEPDRPECLDLPWRHPSSRRHRNLIAGPDHDRPSKPMAAQSRATLLQGIARGRRWLDEIMNAASATPESIAAREGCTRRQVNATLSLASLSPAIIEAVFAGCVPYGIGLRDLTDPPLAWSEQQRIVGRAS